MIEEWRDIKDYEGQYKISNTGKVKSLRYCGSIRIQRDLKPCYKKKDKISGVYLYKNDKRSYKSIGRLVIETFTNIKLKNTDVIAYKDNNPLNCCINNLYVITRSEVMERNFERGLKYRRKFEYYGEMLPIKEISKKTGIDKRLIRVRIHDLCWGIYECEIPKQIHKKKGSKIWK